MNIDIKNLNEKLLYLFPNLSDKFNEETSWQDGIYTGSIVVFEDVFMPYIAECIENNNDENLGARRLHAIMEKLLEDVLFTAGENTEEVTVDIDKKYVDEHLNYTRQEVQLAKYIL